MPRPPRLQLPITRPPVLPVLLATLALVAVAFVALAGLVWWGQERIVFQPPRGPWPDAGATRRIEYEAADGARLYGWVVGEPGPGVPLLLVFHGNADLAVRQLGWARELVRRTGGAALLAEYRGYAGNGGTPSYAGSALDARAAYDAARATLGARPGDVVVFGHSLGSAIATELASALDAAGTPPRALLLVSPFTSAQAMARLSIARPLRLVWSAISRVHYDTERRVATLGVPVHVAHGTGDMLIPIRMGRAVHAAARVKGALLEVVGAGHNDVIDTGGERFWRWIVPALAAPALVAEGGDGAGRGGRAARP